MVPQYASPAAFAGMPVFRGNCIVPIQEDQSVLGGKLRESPENPVLHLKGIFPVDSLDHAIPLEIVDYVESEDLAYP